MLFSCPNITGGFFGRTDAKAKTTILWPCKDLTHLKRLWCWEGLGAGGEGDDRGWDGWMASLTWWTWVWVNSGSWWWTGRPGVLKFMGSQKVGHDWVTELSWTELNITRWTVSLHWLQAAFIFQGLLWRCCVVPRMFSYSYTGTILSQFFIKFNGHPSLFLRSYCLPF